jgi:hypothetical protein
LGQEIEWELDRQIEEEKQRREEWQKDEAE